MDEIYGISHSTGGEDDDNLLLQADYSNYSDQLQLHQYDQYEYPPRIAFDQSEGGFGGSANTHDLQLPRDDDYDVIKSRIAAHPSYPKLLDAYLDCQKVGAPPEIATMLEEIRREKDDDGDGTVGVLGLDPELDDFMETYYDVLVKYKTDLSRPIDEATSFLTTIQTQLANLCKDDDTLSSDEEFSGVETEVPDPKTSTEDRELKDRLFRRYGNHINSLKVEFSKKKKKGKLPKEARQTLLEWWSVHFKWPYPTEVDKTSLAETTGLDQKQINNWFINQRKRHWKPSENMHIAMMDNLSGHFILED